MRLVKCMSTSLSLGLVLALACAAQAQSDGTFTFTGSLHTARGGQTATLLNNGMVLIAGGANGTLGSPSGLSSAELYNPSTGTFTATGNMTTARFDHTATLLSNGEVLLTGGLTGSYPYLSLASAELYNPSTGTFTATGSLNTARSDHTATLLSNGMVLIAGGFGVSGNPSNAELYNPSTGTFANTGSLNTARYSHTATLLNSGEVLIAGGFGNAGYLSSAELYNPSTGTFTVTGPMIWAVASHTATLLSNGMVLIAGGDDFEAISSAELYNPSTGTFTATGNMTTARFDHTSTELSDGIVLIAGGYGASNDLSSAELYDGTFTATGSLNTARYEHSATLLGNGKVLIAGGYGSVGYLSSAELFQLNGVAPSITSANGVTFMLLTEGTFTLTATGSPAPTLSESGALPSGITFNTGTGILSGIPGTTGTYPITFTASNGVGSNATQNFTLTVQPYTAAPYISSDNGATFTVGAAGSFAVTATGGPTPTLSESGTLPSGVSFNTGTGILGGTPASGTNGTYSITFTASNGVGSNATQNFTLTVATTTASDVFYYLDDSLGTTRMIANSSGTMCYDADFYPFGGERAYTTNCAQNYKFTGKERDSESGLDDFGARYYSSQFGRFMTPDWSAQAEAVPYAKLGNPQSLNLYAYVGNNPESLTDPDGHCAQADAATCAAILSAVREGADPGAAVQAGQRAQNTNQQKYDASKTGPEDPTNPGKPLYQNSVVKNASNRAWMKTANGTAGGGQAEAGFSIENKDGKISVGPMVMSVNSDVKNKLNIPVDDYTIAVFHTHGNELAPTPGPADWNKTFPNFIRSQYELLVTVPGTRTYVKLPDPFN